MVFDSGEACDVNQDQRMSDALRLIHDHEAHRAEKAAEETLKRTTAREEKRATDLSDVRGRMTHKGVTKLCKYHDGYSSPELNDVIHLHYGGYSVIENLELFTGVRVLWLEGNCIKSISGLDSQTELRTLYLQKNQLEVIGGLGAQTKLEELNVSDNNIKRFENLGHLAACLHTVNLANNNVQTAEDCRALLDCPALRSVDLRSNKIDDTDIVAILAQMPHLHALGLQGNPVVSKIPNYRKQLVCKCKKLGCLDGSPILPHDRTRCEVWMAAFEAAGGNDPDADARKRAEANRAANAAEQVEIRAQAAKKLDDDERCFRGLEEIIANAPDVETEEEYSDSEDEGAGSAGGAGTAPGSEKSWFDTPWSEEEPVPEGQEPPPIRFSDGTAAFTRQEVTPAAAPTPGFIRCSSFTGAMAGFEFKTGGDGTGYYPVPGSVQKGGGAGAAAAPAPAAAVAGAAAAAGGGEEEPMSGMFSQLLAGAMEEVDKERVDVTLSASSGSSAATPLAPAPAAAADAFTDFEELD
jgi:dynein assembly factor 1